jgi:hypothetical protein
MRLGMAFNPLWIYQLESMVLGKTKPSICCICHGWRIITLCLPCMNSSAVLYELPEIGKLQIFTE